MLPENAPQKLSHRNRATWWQLLMFGLAIVVLLLGLFVWVAGQFKQSITIGELRAEATALDLSVYDPGTEDKKRQLRPTWPCATWAELDSIAANGEPVLFIANAQPFTWLDMTGVSFADSLRAARELDASLSEESAEVLRAATGVSFVPGTGGPYHKAETLGARFLNSCINSMIVRGYQYHAGLRFLSEHKVNLEKRINFIAAWKADERDREFRREYLKSLREARQHPERAEAIRKRFKSSTQNFTPEQWLNAVSQPLSGFEKASEQASEQFNRVVPRDWPSGTPIAKWHRWDWESRFHRIAIYDYVDSHPEIYGPLAEERDGARDWVCFQYFRPGDVKQVKSILKTISRPDGTIDHALAAQQLRISSGISDTAFITMGKDFQLKDVYSDTRSLHGIPSGQLTFRLPTPSQPNNFGFEFYSRIVTKPRYTNYRGYTNTRVMQFGIGTIIREILAKVEADFQPHTSFPINQSHIGTSLGQGVHFLNLWEEENAPGPFIRSTVREREIIENKWNQVSSGKPISLPDWPIVEENWKAKRYRTSMSILSRAIRNSSWTETEKNQWLQVVRIVESLPSIVSAPK